MSIDLVVGLKFALILAGLVWLAWRQTKVVARGRTEEARREAETRDGGGAPPS